MKTSLICLLFLTGAAAAFDSPLLSDEDRATLRAAVAAHEYRIETRTEGGFSAPRCTLGSNLVFDDTGFTVQTADGTWGLEMTRSGALHTSSQGNHLHRARTDGVTEWFINDGRGLEQGWILCAPVEGVELRVRGGMRAEVTRECVHFGGALTYAGLKAWDANGRDVPVWFEATEAGFAVHYADADASYPITIDPLAQTTYFKASNTGEQDRFGSAIALSGNTVVIGAPQEDSNATTVNGNQADDSASNAGAVYVFVRSGSTWVQQAYLKAPNAEAGDAFGFSLAISGDTLVVGSTGEDSNATGVNGNLNDNGAMSSGAAYVFTRKSGAWTFRTYLKASNTEAADLFGRSVAIDGNTLVVGALGERSNSGGVNGNQADNSLSFAGAAYVFTRTGSTWAQQAYLKSSHPSGFGNFGFVSISGETIVVGESGNSSAAIGVNGDEADTSAVYSGAAFVFTRTAGVWSQQAFLKASNTASLDYFGGPVIIDGDTIVAGAFKEDSAATGVNGNQADNSAKDSGAAYVFTRTAGVWSQQAYLKASNTGNGDNFGASVAIHGDTIVVGAVGEESLFAGNEADNSGTNCGAAYVFRWRGSDWAQQSYLKPSVTGQHDAFGYSVAVFEGLILVGSFESSAATGINGSQDDNSALSAGAAYLFESRPTLTSLSRSYRPAPGGPDLTFRVPGYAAISPAGEVLFESTLSGLGAPAGKNKGMFSTVAGPVDLTLQTGSVVGGMLGMAAGVRVTQVFGAVHNSHFPVGVLQAIVSGTGITRSSNRLMLVDNGSYVSPIFRTGVPVAALGGAVPAALNEVLQQSGMNTGLALSYRLGGVPASTDSGLLFIATNGSVTDASVREGALAPGGGSYGQIGRAAQLEADTDFIAKWIPAAGQPAKDALFKPAGRLAPLQGEPAAGTTLGERYGTFTGLGQGSGFGLLRATLTNSAPSTNEGVWLDLGMLVLRKGDDTGGGLLIKKIVRVWGVNAVQVVAQVLLSGPGVTAANNQALVLKSMLSNDYQILARSGSAVSGIFGNPKLAAFKAIEVDPVSGNYACLISLSGSPANANLALIAGKTTLGNSTTLRNLRLPELVMRKGGRYRSSLTPDDTIVSIALKPAVDASGVGGRGLGQVINDDGQILAVLTGNSGAVELVRVEP